MGDQKKIKHGNKTPNGLKVNILLKTEWPEGLSHQEIDIKKMGSHEPCFNENNVPDRFWALPNVIGVQKR